MLKNQARKLLSGVNQASAGLRSEAGCIATMIVERKTPVKLLLVSDLAIYTSEQQFAPFKRFSRELRRELGIVTRFMTVERAGKMSARQWAQFNVIGLKFSFRADEPSAMALAQRIHNAIDGTSARLVYFDGDDDLNILWPELVRLVDVYVKKHMYRDRADNAVLRNGKSNLTDWVVHEHGQSFDGNEITCSRPLDLSLSHKLWTGWNIGLDDKIATLASRMPPPSADQRPVDVCSRALVSENDWIFPLREKIITQLEHMSSSMKVLVPRARVSQEQYYEEMRMSKICVSPFGYGEICWRDYEAILLGCLLVKPYMGHVETAPDIFIPEVTYVPVKWDFSDLPQVCTHYLADSVARSRIVKQAFTAVMESQRPDWFIGRVRALLQKAAIR